MTSNGNKKALSPDKAASASVQFQSDGVPGMYYDGQMPDGFIHSFQRLFATGEELPAWWSPSRDAYLRRLIRKPGMLSGVVFQEVARVSNSEWSITDERGRKSGLSRWQNLLLSADMGKGFRHFLQRIAVDLLSQDNGAFVELLPQNPRKDDIQQNDKYGLKVTRPNDGPIGGIMSMDAARCWRTFDNEYPVLYTNPYPVNNKPYYVLLHKTRVHTMSQFPQNLELGRGIGVCAVSRLFTLWRLIRDMNTYRHEKLSGTGPELHFIQGVPPAMLQRLKDTMTQMEHNKDLTKFGASFLAGVPAAPNSPPVSINTVGVKSVPDGFNYKEDLTLEVMQLAVSMGVDMRDIGWPGVGGGQTRADAMVSDLKAAGKGRADIKRAIQDFVNFCLFPPHKTFEFKDDNRLTEQFEAETRQIRAQTRQIQILSGEISVAEARQIAAQNGDIDASFVDIADDMTEESGIDREQEATTEEKAVGTKAYNDIRDMFMLLAKRLVDEAQRNRINQDEFISQFRGLINTFGSRAYLQGIQDGGAKGINTISELEPGERIEMNVFLTEQRMFVRGLADSIYGGRGIMPLEQRLHLWAQKGLDSIYNKGFLSGAGNSNLEWILGETEEHCEDCQKLAGRVYRARTWDRYNIQPRSPELSCQGFQCDCRLEKTNKRVTPGRPPILSGQKAEGHKPADAMQRAAGRLEKGE